MRSAQTRRPLKFRALDDHLQLKDATMQVDLYHVVSNSHMAEGLFAYVPDARLLVEGDFFDVGWELYWWQKTYADNIAYRHLRSTPTCPYTGACCRSRKSCRTSSARRRLQRICVRACSRSACSDPDVP